MRGTLDADGRFQPAGLQESHALFSLSRANALVRVPPGVVWPAGGHVRVHLL
jgi:molybdopterin biosynthesis enzyme